MASGCGAFTPPLCGHVQGVCGLPCNTVGTGSPSGVFTHKCTFIVTDFIVFIFRERGSEGHIDVREKRPSVASHTQPAVQACALTGN